MTNIYKGSRDGWEKVIFASRVFDKGPTLIIVKSTTGAIFGGYTSKNWAASGGFVKDTDAFVFNLNTKYTPSNYDYAVHMWSNGF